MHYNFSFDKHSDDVITMLSDGLDIDLNTESQNDDDINDGDDGIDIDLGDDDEKGTSLEPLIKVFDDLKQREMITNKVIDVCDSLYEQNRQGEVGRRALNSILAANKNLQGVDISKADPATYSTIEAQLEAVMERAESLSATLEPYMGLGKNPG